MTEEMPTFVVDDGWSLRFDESADSVWITHGERLVVMVFTIETFEALVAFWLCRSPRLLRAAIAEAEGTDQ